MSPECYEESRSLTLQLKALQAKHGQFNATEWLMYELVRIHREQQAKSRIDKAEYVGEGFKLTLRLTRY